MDKRQLKRDFIKGKIIMKILDRIFKRKPIDGMCHTETNIYLKTIVENWDVTNPDRYNIFDNIIKQTYMSNALLDILACAYANHFSKADHRRNAIDLFEKFLSNEHCVDIFPIENLPQFSMCSVCRDLGKDYEGEYEFEKAEFYYKESLKYTQRRYSELTGNYDVLPSEIMLGRLYLKISTEKALKYWEQLKQYDEYKKGNPDISGFHRSVDIEYKNALEKHKKGYVYKPRKNK